jgi:DNA-binding winged helix-turn-helix (wHTH) protein
MTLRFGDFVLDSDARQLRRKDVEVRLSPKAFDLLRALVTRRPDVVSKRDLMALIWPDTFVVEANLNVVIAEIRRALGDDRQSPRFVRTVHGVGYAFCGLASDVRDGGTGTTVREGARSSADLKAAPSTGLRASCWLVLKHRTFPLSPGENLIGRDPRSAVWIEDESVSRRHALINVDADAATVEDLESTNGTFLNRGTIDGPAALQDGDIVRIGSIRLTFRMLSAAAGRTRRLRRGSESK